MCGKLLRRLLRAALLLLLLPARGQHAPAWQLEDDTLRLCSGTTYRYTVDTPEGEGLVPTLPTVGELLTALSGSEGGRFRITDARRRPRTGGYPVSGDWLERLSPAGKPAGRRRIVVCEAALPPLLRLHRDTVTAGVAQELTLDFFAGQRTPRATVEIWVPAGIAVTPDNVLVDVIGRGAVLLRDLPRQSIGRTGTRYSYARVGEATLLPAGERGTCIRFEGLDLRPSNGADLRLVIKGATVPAGSHRFEAAYTVAEPQPLASLTARTTLTARMRISDFEREPLHLARYNPGQDYTWASFAWTPVAGSTAAEVLWTRDEGRTWEPLPDRMQASDADGQLNISRLEPDRLYGFRLRVTGGPYRGESNPAWYYAGEWDARACGVRGDGTTDDTDRINRLLARIHRLGGGVLRLPAGDYPVRTLHMQSHVWLHVDSGAVVRALPGGDAPETTWFSDRAYRSGLSPVDPRPYEDPENYLTKQDVGHTFFRNAMFFGERLENVKIVGTGRITGDGNLATSDRVMNNDPDRRSDKMFSFKLCRDLEIGGIETGRDLWYDPDRDAPYYLEPGGGRDYADAPMLHIDQGGHFVLLATGTDGIYVHDTFFGRASAQHARDIYDFMACNDVRVQNIYSRVSSDDIVKPGSDCSLGFTRPASDYRVRNIIGDTNCNLFQIGSETADDIENIWVDNIYVLGANKAGFSISTNDGGHVRNVWLNSGRTGPLHARSVMLRTRAPFFISISNRGRVLGAAVERFTFRENGAERSELLVTNSSIGRVENIHLRGVDISEVYGGSSFRGERWRPYDGTQHEATPIVAGFKLPDDAAVEGGLPFRLPDGRHTGFIRNVRLSDLDVTVKGGHPAADAEAVPPEIGVGRYNVSDLKIQPAFGLWFRHVEGLEIDGCRLRAEQPDGRPAVVLDDVHDAVVRGLRVAEGSSDRPGVVSLRSERIVVE